MISYIGYMTNLRNRIWNGNVANVYNFSLIFKKQFSFIPPDLDINEVIKCNLVLKVFNLSYVLLYTLLCKAVVSVNVKRTYILVSNSPARWVSRSVRCGTALTSRSC